MDLRSIVHHKGNEIRKLNAQAIKFEDTDKAHYEWLQKLQDEVNDIEKRKCDTKDFITDINKLEMNFR